MGIGDVVDRVFGLVSETSLTGVLPGLNKLLTVHKIKSGSEG